MLFIDEISGLRHCSYCYQRSLYFVLWQCRSSNQYVVSLLLSSQGVSNLRY